MFDRIKRKFYSTLERGLKDERGVFVLVFAILLSVALGATGIALEGARVAAARQTLQNIAEKVSQIALRTYIDTQDMEQAEEAARDHLNSVARETGLDTEGIWMGLRKVPDGANPRLNVYIFSSNPGNVRIGYVEELSITATSKVAEKDTEIAVVLDISGSMRWAGRMDKAKGSLRDFSDNMFRMFQGKVTNLAISLVPYAGSVYLGSSYTDFHYFPGVPTISDWGGCPQYWEQAQRGWTDSIVGPGGYYLKAMADVSGPNLYNDTWCPTRNNRILEFAETTQDFKAAVDSLTFGDGTSTDMGMAWGFRLLSQKWRGRFKTGGPQRPSSNSARINKFPLDLKPGTKQKHLILLTDGRINVYHSDYTDQQAERNFQETCKNIGEAGIVMHIVGYDVKGSPVERELQECAGNSGVFYNADTQTLRAVFKSIQNNVMDLKTTSR